MLDKNLEEAIEDLLPHHHQMVPLWRIVAAGATAGLLVDTALFPVDTIKSRAQSKAGFLASGGFRGIYRGLPTILVGSIPNAALFFITYETFKQHFGFVNQHNAHLNNMLAASLGELLACSIRVPYEVVKMRAQTSLSPTESTLDLFKTIVRSEGIKGLYRGLTSTLTREIPFSMIQYPIWERLRISHKDHHGQPVSALESAYYGSLAGGIAAFLTTPLDVAKTRIMLASSNEKLAMGNVGVALKQIYLEKGFLGLFAGALPRVLWISAGGAIFLGSYEKVLKLTSPHRAW